MARSAYIYVVTGQGGPIPEAAFTVKHELRTWLLGEPLSSLLQVFRVPDNFYVSRQITEMSVEEIFNG